MQVVLFILFAAMATMRVALAQVNRDSTPLVIGRMLSQESVVVYGAGNELHSCLSFFSPTTENTCVRYTQATERTFSRVVDLSPSTAFYSITRTGNLAASTVFNTTSPTLFDANLISLDNFRVCPSGTYLMALSTGELSDAVLFNATFHIGGTGIANGFPFLHPLYQYNIIYMVLKNNPTDGGYLISKCFKPSLNSYAVNAFYAQGEDPYPCLLQNQPTTNCPGLATTSGELRTQINTNRRFYCTQPEGNACFPHKRNDLLFDQLRLVCEPGFYCDNGFSTTICPEGRYCPAGTTVPLNCPANRYCPARTAVPLVCPAGRQCLGNTGSNPPLCSPGYFCPEGQSRQLCDEDALCPAGSSEQGPICSWTGTASADGATCICYFGFEGENCDFFTLFPTNIGRFSLASALDQISYFTVNRENSIFSDTYRLPYVVENNVRIPAADLDKCPYVDQGWSLPSNHRAEFPIRGCCYEIRAPVSIAAEFDIRQPNELLELSRVVCSYGGLRNTSQFNFVSEIFLGVAALDQADETFGFFYCCNRFRARNPDTMFQLMARQIQLQEEATGVHALPPMRNYTETRQVISKLYQAAYLMFSTEQYYLSHIVWSYLYFVLKSMRRNIDESPVLRDEEDLIARTRDNFWWALDLGYPLVDPRTPKSFLTRNLDETAFFYDWRPEFTSLDLKFAYLGYFGALFTDTLASFLRPLTADLTAFQYYADENEYLELELMHQCRFETGSNRVILPSCDTDNSYARSLECAAGIARCALIPRSTALTEFASNVVPSHLYVSRAFHCLKLIQKEVEFTTANKINQYENAVNMLQTILMATRAMQNEDQATEREALLRLIRKEYDLISIARTNFLGKTQVPIEAIQVLRDNTIDFYKNQLQALETKLDRQQVIFRFEQLEQNILQEIQSQTTRITQEFQTNTLSLFRYMNSSFTATKQASYLSSETDDRVIALEINNTVASLQVLMNHMVRDLNRLRSYLDTFEDRTAQLYNSSANRIEYLYQMDRARQDIQAARRALLFIIGVVVAIIAAPLSMGAGVAIAGPTLGGVLAVGGTAAITGTLILPNSPHEQRSLDEAGRRLIEAKQKKQGRRQLQQPNPVLASKFALYNYTDYAETTMSGLFGSFSPTAEQIVADTIAICEDLPNLNDLNLNLNSTERNTTSAAEIVVSCIERFETMLYNLLKGSIAQDYALGCANTAFGGFRPNDISFDAGRMESIIEPLILQLYNATKTVRQFTDQVFQYWTCENDFFAFDFNLNTLYPFSTDVFKVSDEVLQELEMSKTIVLEYIDLNLAGLTTMFGSSFIQSIQADAGVVPLIFNVSDRFFETLSDADWIVRPRSVSNRVVDDEWRQYSEENRRTLSGNQPSSGSTRVNLNLVERQLEWKTFQLERRKPRTSVQIEERLKQTDAFQATVLQDTFDLDPTKPIAAATRLIPNLPGRSELTTTSDDENFRRRLQVKFARRSLQQQGVAFAQLEVGSSPRPAFQIESQMMNDITATIAARKAERDEATKNINQAASAIKRVERYNTLETAIDGLLPIVGRISAELTKQSVLIQILANGYECNQIYDDATCKDLQPDSPNMWNDLAFVLVNYTQSGSGLCPLTADDDVVQERRRLGLADDGELSRGLSMRRGSMDTVDYSLVERSRRLGPLADKRAAEDRLAQNRQLYIDETKRMHEKYCPEFFSVVDQMTLFGKNVQTSMLQVIEKINLIKTLNQQRQAILARNNGLRQAFEDADARNQAFMQERLDLSNAEIAKQQFIETTTSVTRFALTVRQNLDSITDLEEYNVFFKEVHDYLRYILVDKFTVPLDDFQIRYVEATPAQTFTRLINKVTEIQDHINALENANVFGGVGFVNERRAELFISPKVDMNTSVFRSNRRSFQFDLRPPPFSAYRDLDLPDELSYDRPWFSTYEQLFVHDIHLAYFRPTDGTLIRLPSNNQQSGSTMTSTLFMGPIFNQIYSDNNGPFRSRFMFDIDTNAFGFIDPRIRFTSTYNRIDSSTGLPIFNDNIIADNAANPNGVIYPRMPLPTVYTQYEVVLSDETRNILLDEMERYGPLDVRLYASFFAKGNAALNGPRLLTSAPTISATIAPTLDGQTNSPTTESPTTIDLLQRYGFAGFQRDPVECDPVWRYRKTGTSPIIDVDTDDNCLSIVDPETRPYAATNVDLQRFPLFSTQVPAGYAVNSSRWCSVRQTVCSPDPTKPNFLIYNPAAPTGSLQCDDGRNDPRTAWGFCARRIPTPPPVPTVAVTLSPTPRPTGEARLGLLPFESTIQFGACDEAWSYSDFRKTPDVDNCLDINEFPPAGLGTENFDSSNVGVANLPAGFYVSNTRWCSRINRQCNKADGNYEPLLTTGTGTCLSAAAARSAWAWCILPLAEDATQFPTSSPTQKPTYRLPLAIGGFRNPNDGPIECDTGSLFKQDPNSFSAVQPNGFFPGVGAFSFAQTTTPFRDAATEYPFSSIRQSMLPDGALVTQNNWCSFLQTKCSTDSAVYMVNPFSTDGGTCSQYEMVRSWGYLVYSDEWDFTERPTSMPTVQGETPRPTLERERYPRAYRGYVDPNANEGLGIACDTGATYSAVNGGPFIAPDSVTGCFPLQSPTLPFGFENPTWGQGPTDFLNGAEVVDYGRWCSIRNELYNTGADKAYYLDGTRRGDSEATTRDFQRAWGYCRLPESLTSRPTFNPTPFPTIAGELPPSTLGPTPSPTEPLTLAEQLALLLSNPAFFYSLIAVGVLLVIGCGYLCVTSDGSDGDLMPDDDDDGDDSGISSRFKILVKKIF